MSQRPRRLKGDMEPLWRRILRWDPEAMSEYRRQRRRQLGRPDGMAFIDLGLDREGCKALERAMMGWEEIR